MRGVYDTDGEMVKRTNHFGRVLEEQPIDEPEREYVVPAWKRLELGVTKTHNPIDAGCGGAHCAIVLSSKQGADWILDFSNYLRTKATSIRTYGLVMLIRGDRFRTGLHASQRSSRRLNRRMYW